MSRLSNKGQSLALFVVFIPLIIMLGCLVIDLGFAKYNKNKLNELTKMVTSYGVKHIDEEPYNEMVDLLYQNDDSIDNYKIEVKPDEKIFHKVIKKINCDTKISNMHILSFQINLFGVGERN